MMRQYELVERVKAYDPTADEDALNRAYVFAVQRHGSQLRASGDPYFSHPVEVAGILTRYRLDTATIITALLHDTIEDTDVTLDEVTRLFGGDVARLVDGVTKLARIELQSDQTKQAENFRKLLLAMSEDIRVLLVKLADRVHNMRTLHYIKKPEKRRRIALETMEIYAPLAERIGMQEFKVELEESAFAELHPDAHASIVARLRYLEEQGGDLVSRVIGELRDTLAHGGVQATLSGREKTPCSIWRKMQRKDVAFEQLSDIMAFRVLVPSVEDCYRTLGLLHAAYPMVPGRFKDYISTPKPNGYQSLHTGIIGPQRHRIEIQIRTHAMHDIAEMGVAAHWNYKQEAVPAAGPLTDGRQYRWVRELLEILDHATNPEEFLEHTKLEMFQDQVFCFTPKGDLIALPGGATPVDFAYAVHTHVGDTCVGAKVNGRIVPLRSILSNGDQVEVITSPKQTPNPEWERFVASGKARARIRRYIRNQQKGQHTELGRKILSQAFRDEGYEMTDKALSVVLKKFKVDTVDDLCAHVGEGIHTGREVVLAVYPGLRMAKPVEETLPRPRHLDGRHREKNGSRRHAVAIKGLIPGMALHYAKCCHPLPGDRIVGIVTTGKGVTIHTIDCEQLGPFSDQPERWLDLAWDQEGTGQNYIGRVNLVVSNETGSLGVLSTIIAKNMGNITNLKITGRTAEFFDMIVDIDVRDVKHLINIIAALRATPSVSSVERARK
ncbi:bifunctional (p)ppGpp synthetase/guanosine-3',5'-bis(diphosphate) 3'-pyrophosphohydrolase [Haematospirillum sp. H1815]|uniref:RelA/SpoT family protein n=1 Tax=Haematospirillum sp. H1815 TaxID=2723108 RepID=UPI00143A9DB9|nr:bifunctional (p)ppGpp synthetase/guanosine-3',5'-bis(diphosphate) 3'-pyrophosphohydrolase [Haematospirillum sp. H1815]NKD76524.1 bifunctional (p)ppGpp synthetase/guanosine-3',5'-bis(diphosphate) 3'-pyrophosphohydrolase [Haematospirillum sp. H1815]